MVTAAHCGLTGPGEVVMIGDVKLLCREQADLAVNCSSQ